MAERINLLTARNCKVSSAVGAMLQCVILCLLQCIQILNIDFDRPVMIIYSLNKCIFFPL